MGVTASLEDVDWYVRRTAVKKLPEVVNIGDPDAIETICLRTQHSEPDVRRAALEALCEVAEIEDKRAVAAVRLCLGDPDELVRRVAEEAEEFLREPVDPLEKAKSEPPFVPSPFVVSLLEEQSTAT